MKRRIFHLLSLTLLALGGTGPLFAWDGAFFDLFQVPFTAREAAMGGNHAAQADDVSTLISNPAGFRSAGPELSIGAVDLSFYTGPTDPGGDQLSTVNLFGPLAIAYVGNGLGFGLFSQSTISTRIRGPYPAAGSILTENLILIAGYAFRIPLPEETKSTLDIGFSVPFFLAARSRTARDVRGLIASTITPLEFVIDQPFTFAAGISAELGILYNWNDTFSVGIAARNLAITTWEDYLQLQDYLNGATPIQTTTPFPMDISLGVRWTPPIKMQVSVIDGFSLVADYNDIFDFIIYPRLARNPLLHFGLGVEITLLQVVKLRAGLFQLLPCGGLSLDLSFFNLDLAVFGRELSTQPWTAPVYGFMAGVRFHA